VTGEADPDVLRGVVEDLEDLKAKHRALSAQLKALTESAGGEPVEALGEDDPTTEATDPETADEDEGGEEAWQFPSFILLLDSPQYETELRALTEWAEGVLVSEYLAEPSADAR
jgi:hypothetical protein